MMSNKEIKNKTTEQSFDVRNAFQTKRMRVAMEVLSIAFLVTVCSCEKPESTTTTESTTTISLQGTTWKLEGILDMQTNDLQVLEPMNCQSCYTFTFDTDSTAIGKSVANEIWLVLRPPFVLRMTLMDDTGIGDVDMYYAALSSIESYTLSDANLRFYYNDKKECLTFKKIEQ